jgi:fumarate reductase flavoprotein subunit
VRIPVVVVGAGACGLTAAVAARDTGAEVLVLERDASPSGSTALSSGFVPAAATRFQAAAGVEDSPERMFQDVQRKNGGHADPKVARTLCEASGPTIEWLADAHGVPFELVQGFRYPGHSALRMHSVPEKTGAALMAALLRACSGIDILCSARVVDVTSSKVVYERPNGTTGEVEYGALVLACSGFGGNPAMVREHIPEVSGALYFGHAGNQGDAVRWGSKLGAAVEHMGAYQGHGSVATPQNILITWALMTEGGIQVNSRGERFSNEHSGYSEQCQAVLAQPGGFAWCVYDEPLHRLGMTFPDYRDAHDAGAIRKGFELDGLDHTLAAVARYREAKESDPFGRDFRSRPRLKPPYYAVKVTGALFHTQGGLEIDEQARVLDRVGNPLPRLFAGGGAACGISGSNAAGYLSGNGLLSAITLGRIAGVNASAAGASR